MKINKLIFLPLIIIFLAYTDIVQADNGTTLFNLNTPNKICDSVKNDNFKIYVHSYYGNNDTLVPHDADACENTAYFNSNMSNLHQGDNYNSWTRYGLFSNFYSNAPSVVVEGQSKSFDSKYNYFVISNRNASYENNILKRTHTLKPGERIFFEVELDSPISVSSYNDLRINIDYVNAVDSDINISEKSSISYYVYNSNDGRYYGPYKQYSDQIKDIFYINKTKSQKNHLISENVLTGIPSNGNITKIKIIPYNNYSAHTGAFKINSLSVTGYANKYSDPYNYLSQDQSLQASGSTRHKIVNNMVEMASIKWTMSKNNYLYFYDYYPGDNPDNDPPKNYTPGNIYYGIPYANRTNAALSTFINTTTESKNKTSNNAYYSYNLTTRYFKDETTTNGTTVTKGETIPLNNNQLKIYAYENNDEADKVGQRGEELSRNPYLLNSTSAPYFRGNDCASSVAVSAEQEVPYNNAPLGSTAFYFSNTLRMLGDLEFNLTEFEDYLRSNNIINQSTQMSRSNYFADYYAQYMREKYTQEEIYRAYAEVKPGDVLARAEHTRIATGIPHVVYNTDGTIDGSNSYLILSEQGWNKRETTVIINDTPTSDTDNNFKITFNSNITDISSVLELKDVGNTKYIVNKKYTFKDLYGGDSIKLFMPFRYKMLEKMEANNQIVVPTAQIVNSSNKLENNGDNYLRGLILTNYMIDSVRYEINDKTYYDYPGHTNHFSLYEDTSLDVQDALNEIGSKSNYNIKVSVKTGPMDTSAIRSAAGADSSGYIEVLSIGNSRSLSIKKLPTKTKYILNKENLDLTGGELKVSYANGETDTIPLTNEGVQVTGFSNKSLGSKTITVKYDDMETTFDVSIIDDSINSINIKSLPSKTKYYINKENLDLTGGLLEVIYESGTTDTIPLTNKDIEVTGFDNSSLGVKELQATYNEKTAVFNVEVIEDAIQKIELLNLPTKNKYILNKENLDLTGGLLKVTYESGETDTIPLTNEDVKISNFSNTKLGNQSVTLEYNGQTVTFDVEVISDVVNDINNPQTGISFKTIILLIALIGVYVYFRIYLKERKSLKLLK